jgi:hypothetical protein
MCSWTNTSPKGIKVRARGCRRAGPGPGLHDELEDRQDSAAVGCAELNGSRIALRSAPVAKLPWWWPRHLGGRLGWSAAGFSIGVDPGGWVELREALDQLDVPARVVDQPVTRPTQQDEVVQTGGAAVLPRDHVVGFAPTRRAPTPGTTPIPSNNSAAQAVGDDAGQSTHIQGLTLAV